MSTTFKSRWADFQPTSQDPAAVEKNMETCYYPTDKTDKSPSLGSQDPFVGFVSPLVARSQENLPATLEPKQETPGTLPPATLRTTPLESATERLKEYRNLYGSQTSQDWLQHAQNAVATARATFSPERQHNALRIYLASYCEGQTAQTIAAHVIALELWAADNRRTPNGVWLDVAAQAVGTDLTPRWEGKTT